MDTCFFNLSIYLKTFNKIVAIFKFKAIILFCAFICLMYVFNLFFPGLQKIELGMCSSLVEPVLSRHKALGSIPSKQINKIEGFC